MPRSHDPTDREKPVPHLLVALTPVLFLVGSLWLTLVHYKELALTTHVPLVAATAVASIVALLQGYSWSHLQDGMVRGITMALNAVLILVVIGLLVGSWIQAGIVPAMVSYGLELFSPRVFLVATCGICSLVSLATGSSWSTAATVGIALMGVGEGLQIPRPMVAGAIISGAYFGDKMSPLSDTTNLAPAVAGTDLFTHIRHMLYTTVPSLLISLVIFFFMGMSAEGTLEAGEVATLKAVIDGAYVIHPLLLLAPVFVILMVVLRIPALPALIGGGLLGGIVAATVQGNSFGEILSVMYGGVTSETGNPMVDELLSKGGLTSMFSTVVLIICALAFGGVMESARMLEVIARDILRLARGAGGLVLATVGTCFGMNVLASDQYLAIVVPGRMYRESFARQGLAPENLSRALEDAGTLTSPLIPWNTCGAYMIATLGLAPWTYVPYCFLNILNPLISVLYGYTGITLRRIETPAKR